MTDGMRGGDAPRRHRGARAVATVTHEVRDVLTGGGVVVLLLPPPGGMMAAPDLPGAPERVIEKKKKERKKLIAKPTWGAEVEELRTSSVSVWRE